MSFTRRMVPRILSALFLSAGSCVFAFLVVWYFELVLWIILGPFAFASIYLALRLWWVSPHASSAVKYWATSVAWALAIVLAMFKDVTLIGGSVAVAVAAIIVWAIHALVRTQLKPDIGAQ